MAYKISGNLGEDATIIVFKESDWSVDKSSEEVAGNYNIEGLVPGEKLIVARKSDGHSASYGNVTPATYQGDRGVMGGGGPSPLNSIEFITISTLSDASEFGDLTMVRTSVTACSNGGAGRGVFAATALATPAMDYIQIGTLGDAANFGNILSSVYGCEATSNLTGDRGVIMGGMNVFSNVIQYITISTESDAIDFGDLLICRGGGAACSNGTNNRGINAGGHAVGGGGSWVDRWRTDDIEYITITSLSNALFFGNLTNVRNYFSGTSNATNDRGIFASGSMVHTAGNLNIIEYITISSAGNSQDFGDLTSARQHTSSVSNATNERAVFTGGYTPSVLNVMDYITISTLGNATEFGELLEARYTAAGCSNA